MKTNRLLAAVAVTTGVFVSSTFAQTPTVAQTTPPAGETSAVQAPASLRPNQIVYSAQLPTPEQLVSAASTQGLTIDRIEQNASVVVAVYKAANGSTNVVSYQVLPPAGAPVSPAGAPSRTTTTTVYAPVSPSVVYYDDPYYYGPYYGYGYPRIALGIGIGPGYYRGGFHHWHR